MPDDVRVSNNIKTVSYQMPEEAKVTAAAQALETAKAIVIDSDMMLEIAMEERGLLKQQIDAIEAERMNITRPIDAAKKSVMDFFKKLTTPREEAVAVIDTSVRAWRKKEADRLALEHAEAEANARKERERLEAEAKAAAAAGKVEEAEVLQQTAAVVIAAPIAPLAKVAGATFPKTWVGEVTDVPAFLRYLADHIDRQGCIEFKKSELNALARSVKKAVVIPGFTATEREGITSR
jgi:hypothetical protein